MVRKNMGNWSPDESRLKCPESLGNIKQDGKGRKCQKTYRENRAHDNAEDDHSNL